MKLAEKAAWFIGKFKSLEKRSEYWTIYLNTVA